MADLKTMQNTILATFPGLPVQIVTSFINTTYRELLRCWQWSATLKNFTLSTVASDSTGTLSFSVNPQTYLTGVGTAFTSEMVGRKIRIDGTATYNIISVANALNMSIDGMFAGEGRTGVTFEIFQDTYALNSTVIELFNMNNESKLVEIDLDTLNRLDPERTSTGVPYYYCKFGRGGGLVSAPAMQVILYPTPLEVYSISYSARIASVDLSAATDVPLLDSDLIVKGAMMYLCSVYTRMGHPEVQQDYGSYKEQFTEAKTDAMMEDLRNQSTSKTIRDVTGFFGGSEFDSNFRQSHDVD